MRHGYLLAIKRASRRDGICRGNNLRPTVRNRRLACELLEDRRLLSLGSWAAWLQPSDALNEIDAAGIDPLNSPPELVLKIASGDTTQDSTVLWASGAVPGDVTFQLATDPGFSNIVDTQVAAVSSDLVPVKVQVDSLESNTEYYYRAMDASAQTAVGRFHTAEDQTTYSGLHFGASADWQQAPPYPSLKNAAGLNLDLFIKMGDTIYGDLETPALPGVTQARTLSDFRIKHNEAVSGRFGANFMAELYSSTSILATSDDHEIVDNFAGGAAPGESPDAPDIGSSPDPLFTDPVDFVNDTQVYEDAFQAFQEYHPLRDEFYGATGDARTEGERRLYRWNSYGLDAAVFMLDTRSFRDAPLEPVDLGNPWPFLFQAFDPSRTLLGQAQLEQLTSDLLAAEEAGVTWKFVVVPEPIQNFGVVAAEDRFEGYAAERAALLGFIDRNNIDNVVFLTGDFHGTIVNNLTYQLGPLRPQIATNAFEIMTGPVAFFDGLFGPTIVNLAHAAGILNDELVAFYDSLPVAGDADSLPNDKDDFLKLLIDLQAVPFGYDPIGLNDNLAIADGLIDATLLEGDYIATHTFGWAEFDIDPDTQQLRVTAYGIEPYSEEDLVADPQSILSRTPQIVSQFVVNPKLSTGARLADSTLVVNGTNADDLISVYQCLSNHDLVVQANGREVGRFNGRSVDLIKVHGLGGNDYLHVDFFVSTDAFLFGGPGNDVLTGGWGNDVLLGGGGHDVLFGQLGRNLLIGGPGSDCLLGGFDDDLLIGGRTAYDNNDAALAAVLAEWSSHKPYSLRVNNLRTGLGVPALNTDTVFDDKAPDILFGQFGWDWFFDGSGDMLVGKMPWEQVN